MPRLPELVPITELRQDAAAVVGKVQKSEGPTIITQRGRAAAVLLSVEAYEQAEKEREMLRVLARGEREIQRGAGEDLDTVLGQLDALIEDHK